MEIVATVQTAAISQNCCCGETAASIWGGCLCLPFLAFHHHVVCLSSPTPPSPSLWLYSSHGTPPHHPLSSPATLPAPPLCALSGHPPCLFRWNRRGNEISESTVNPFLGLYAMLLCVHSCFFSFHLSVSMLWW